MTAKQKNMGYDPLAWMNEDDQKPENIEHASQEIVESPAQQEVVPESSNIQQHPETNSSLSSEPLPTEDLQGQKITLETRHTIQNVGKLYDQLLSVFSNSEQIEIDASNVETIDTATLQLLIVLKLTADKSNKVVMIDFPSDAFIEAAELIGLSEHLGVEKAAAGFF